MPLALFNYKVIYSSIKFYSSNFVLKLSDNIYQKKKNNKNK